MKPWKKNNFFIDLFAELIHNFVNEGENYLLAAI